MGWFTFLPNQFVGAARVLFTTYVHRGNDDFDDFGDYDFEFGSPYRSSLKEGKPTLHEKDDDRPRGEIRFNYQ